MEKRFSVKNVMQLCCVSRKQLFYYEKKGLLKNISRNQENNYRYYTQEDITTIFIIKEYLSMDYTLDEIAVLLGNESIEDIKNYVNMRKMAAQEEFIESLQKYEQSNKKYLQFMEGLSYLSLNAKNRKSLEEQVEFYFIPNQTVIRIDGTGTPVDSIETSESSISPLYEIMRREHLRSCDTLMFQFYDIVEQDASAYIKDERRAARYLPVIGVRGSDAISEFGNLKCASSIYVGNYDEGIWKCYERILAWCREKNIRLRGDSIEQYIIGAELTLNPNLYVTRINLPIIEE